METIIMRFTLPNLLSRILPLDPLIKWSGNHIFMPFYHSIQGKNPLPHIHHLYRLRSKSEFEKDLDFLLKHYQPISLNQLLESVYQKRSLPEKSFFLSFDDGLKEVFEIAAPILEAKGIPATIFVNSAFVDNKGLFFRYKASLLIEQLDKRTYSNATFNQINTILNQKKIPGKILKTRLLNIDYSQKNILDKLAQVLEFSFHDFLNQHQPYLTTQQINQLLQRGFTIGAHSIDHPLFNQLDFPDQVFQIEQSLNFVQQNFKVPYRVFSFPFTDFDIGAELFQTIEDQQLAQLTFGCAGIKKERFSTHLQRFAMEGTAQSARQLLTSAYIYFFLKAFLRKNTIYRP